MLNITYSPSDAELAKKLQTDIAQSDLSLEHSMLVVLASPDSVQDDAVKQAVADARQKGHRIAVLIAKPTAVTLMQGELPALDCSTSYRPKTIVAYLKRVDLGAKRLRRSRQLLAVVGGASLLMFALGIWGILTQQVVFPRDEYATDYAFEQNQISTFVFPTLDAIMPRTTEDALNFQATVDKVPTRNYIFVLQTATSIPMNITATQQALLGIETLAVATSAQMTLQANATPTPTP